MRWRPGELDQTLTPTRLDLRYQPIVGFADRVPIAVEALARLRHPSHGVLHPADFVPHAEEIGLAAALTALVAARACAEMRAIAGSELRVGVNFPLEVILQDDPVSLLNCARDGTDLAPRNVVAELTESRAVHDIPALARSVGRLREAGYGVSLDDVVPEMPFQAELCRLPFTSLKLDKAVVQLACRDAATRDFVSRLVRNAGQDQRLVIAEGIEDAEMWDCMRTLGVGQAQGFLVAPPLDAAALKEWLRGRAGSHAAA